MINKNKMNREFIIFTFLYLSILAFYIVRTNSIDSPIITFLRIDGSDDVSNQTLLWNETGGVVTSRTITFSDIENSEQISVVITPGQAILDNIPYPITGKQVTVTLSNSAGSVFANINISNPCFLGHVLLVTKD